jgi:membrane protein
MPDHELRRRLLGEGTLLRRVLDGFGRTDFGTRIVVFGASMLLSVVPLVVLLSAFASYRVDVDISRHLALSPEGARLVSQLFVSAPATVSLAVLVSLALSFVGAVSVARSVQTGYEAVFERPAARGTANLGRCCAWLGATGALLIADGFVAPHVGDGVRLAGYRLVEAATLVAYFAWTMRFLLRASVPWRRLVVPAVFTSVCWVGLRGFAALYFSPTVVSDGHTYGTVGVVFTLLTWFIAIDAVVLLGAIIGAAVQRRAASPQGSAD